MCIASLFKGVCAEFAPIECCLLSVVEELDEHHPIIERLAKRGAISRFEERATLETMGPATCGASRVIGLTICPTMGCDFDRPHRFEDHGRGTMSAEVQ